MFEPSNSVGRVKTLRAHTHTHLPRMWCSKCIKHTNKCILASIRVILKNMVGTIGARSLWMQRAAAAIWMDSQQLICIWFACTLAHSNFICLAYIYINNALLTECNYNSTDSNQLSEWCGETASEGIACPIWKMHQIRVVCCCCCCCQLGCHVPSNMRFECPSMNEANERTNKHKKNCYYL